MTTMILDGTNGVTFPNGTVQAAAMLGETSLTGYYYPAAGSAYQDCYRAGFLPSWFNQQWGGAQWGTLPDGSFGSVATGQIEANSVNSSGLIGYNAGSYYIAQGFKVSDTATYDAVWVKFAKFGNPTANLTARIWSDSAGSPSAAIGSAATLSMKLVTSKSDGEWYQITGLAAALTAGTQYHLVLSTLAAVDSTNYVACVLSTTKKYPHGNYNAGTSGGSWTPQTAYAICFLIQNPAANSLIQSSGMFDYKLAFNPGTPVNQSRSVAQPLANFYDGKTCSVLYRGTYAVSTNVWDFTYGLDHDRITLTINASGFPVLTIYESDRTVATVTGTGSVASGNHDVGIRVRTVADGADYATLYVDGVSVGTPLTAQTFTMAAEMERLGTARLGDGFGLAPTWTLDQQMTALPSSGAVWTWTGTATEANAMSIQGGKLYQNANGYTSTQTGYYAKTTAFVNGTGWTVSFKMRKVTGTNASGYASTRVVIADGTNIMHINIHEYYLECVKPGTGNDFVVQGDFKSQERVFTLCGKGSDYYLFIDGKLAADGTGRFTAAFASNYLQFGDVDSTAGENGDAIWSYVKYYQGGMILPAATTGTCSEFAHWSGDKSALFPSLWNSGTPVSVKQLCGVPRNYQFEQVVQREVRRGVTSGPTTTASSDTTLTDMECYSIGQYYSEAFSVCMSNTTVNNQYTTTYADGSLIDIRQTNPMVSNSEYVSNILSAGKVLNLGLHKFEGRLRTGAGTTNCASTQRTLTVEARS